MTNINLCGLRDELDLRRRRLCNELDELAYEFLHGRVKWQRRAEFIDSVERLLVDADTVLLRSLNSTPPDTSNQIAQGSTSFATVLQGARRALRLQQQAQQETEHE
jgi:hypothetical protein